MRKRFCCAAANSRGNGLGSQDRQAVFAACFTKDRNRCIQARRLEAAGLRLCHRLLLCGGERLCDRSAYGKPWCRDLPRAVNAPHGDNHHEIPHQPRCDLSLPRNARNAGNAHACGGPLNLCELPAGFRGSFHQEVTRHIARLMHLAPVLSRKLVFMPLRPGSSAVG